MVELLLAASEIGYRLVLAREGAPDSLRTLMSGTGAAIWSVVESANRPTTANATLASLIRSTSLVLLRPSAHAG
jgi:hypothetical protein